MYTKNFVCVCVFVSAYVYILCMCTESRIADKEQSRCGITALKNKKLLNYTENIKMDLTDTES